MKELWGFTSHMLKILTFLVEFHFLMLSSVFWMCPSFTLSPPTAEIICRSFFWFCPHGNISPKAGYLKKINFRRVKICGFFLLILRAKEDSSLKWWGSRRILAVNLLWQEQYWKCRVSQRRRNPINFLVRLFTDKSDF